MSSLVWAQGISPSSVLQTPPVVSQSNVPVRPVPLGALPLQESLNATLKAAVAAAIASGRVPVVELGTPWCPQCRVFDRQLATTRLRNALRGITLIQLNRDDWDETFLRRLGFPSDSLLFDLVRMDTAGQPRGAVLTAQSWAKHTTQLVPSVTEFVRRYVPSPERHQVNAHDSSVVVVVLTKQTVFRAALQSQLAHAVSLGLTPFLELSEPGCGGCQYMDEILHGGGSAEQRAAFTGTYIIQIEPEWDDKTLTTAGLQPSLGFPTFYSVDSTGWVTGHAQNGAPPTADEWRIFGQFIHTHLRGG